MLLDLWLDAVLDAGQVPASITLERRLAMPERYLEVDAERLRRAVLNVAGQCRSGASPRGATGERRIIVTTRSSDAAEMIIEDTGPGISAETHGASIFEPLFSTKSFGAGLGCRRSSRSSCSMAARSTSTASSARARGSRIRLPLEPAS